MLITSGTCQLPPNKFSLKYKSDKRAKRAAFSPASFKRGTFVQRKSREVFLSNEKINEIPVAHRPKDNLVTRHFVDVLQMPPLNKIANSNGVIFDCEEPALID